MLGFAGLDVQPMKSSIFAVWFVPVSGQEHFLKNMEHGINCPWHLSSSERNFSLSPALQLWHRWWWFEYVWMIELFHNLKELFQEVRVQSAFRKIEANDLDDGLRLALWWPNLLGLPKRTVPAGKKMQMEPPGGDFRFFMWAPHKHSIVQFRSLGF